MEEVFDMTNIDALNAYYNNASFTTDSSNSAKTNYTNNSAIGRYFTSTSPEDADAKTIFTNLSIDVGGDGKTITKKQLDSYIDNIKDKKISVPEEELNALNKLKDNWDSIADGGDKINYFDISVKGYKNTLLSMAPDDSGKTIDMSEDAADFTTKINNFLIASALKGLPDESSKTNTYSSMLKTLLTGTTDENDDANADLIGTLINLIAEAQSNSTINIEA